MTMTRGTVPGQMKMDQVISADGTPIGYRRSGQGRPLVLVHGATADHTRWAPLLPALEDHFTVYAVDRRGRGGSGDGPTYTIEREVEDIVAVVDAVGGPVDLLGHSYGALCALEAAVRSDRVGRLVLYEPPVPTGIDLYPAGLVDRLHALLAAGDRDGVLTMMFQMVVRMPPHEVELMQRAPDWPARVAAAHTIPRELEGAVAYRFEPARFTLLMTPTLLLVGGESPPIFTAATAALHAVLPGSRIAVLPGQQHAAISAAPALFLAEVLGFLASEEPFANGRLP
jgi:pimeloyl-ACP methyl ester carboxylesterase